MQNQTRKFAVNISQEVKNQSSPSYVPTMFPKVYRKQKNNESHVQATDTTTDVSDTTTNKIIMEEALRLNTDICELC